MEQDKVLEKAIGQAISRGFWTGRLQNFGEGRKPQIGTYEGRLSVYLPFDPVPVSYEYVVFNHDFAKALWGKDIAQFSEGYSGDTIHLNNIENWKGHLANMVVAEDPIKYLEQNL